MKSLHNAIIKADVNAKPLEISSKGMEAIGIKLSAFNFNTLKNECVNLYEFQTEEALYRAVEEFAYVTYNHVRPHSYNGYRTPYQARIAS